MFSQTGIHEDTVSWAGVPLSNFGYWMSQHYSRQRGLLFLTGLARVPCWRELIHDT
jgi:hypothetical protein